MSIKAIETVYNGYKFRSRLEARWAVFFDFHKIKYEYEKEGFELDSGDRYLPDFYLPDVFSGTGCWIEIKPLTKKEYGKIGDEIPGDEWPTGTAKMAYLLEDNAKGLIIYGNPYPDEYKILRFNSDGYCTEIWFDFYQCLDCGLLTIGYGEFREVFWDQWGDDRKPCRYCKNPISTELHFWLGESFNAARQARFEHGQNGFAK